jgi:hypothetical protein
MKRTTAGWMLLGLLAGLAAVMFNGCVSPQREYLPVTDDHSPNVVQNNPKQGTNYVFSVIEFDDQGEMWEREQLWQTLDYIENAKTNGWPVTLITFVHGWKHDASPDSSNLADFHNFITNLANVYRINEPAAQGTPAKPRLFVGVYIAWRGHLYRDNPEWSVEVPLNLTFWNRKRVGSQVAGISCTEAILSLAAQTRLDDSSETPVAESQVILVGHSFGGLVLERAVTQAMIGSLLANGRIKEAERRGKVGEAEVRPVKPPADLVLLVNPASEGIIAKKMIAAMYNPLVSKYAGSLNKEERPWIISVSSRADWATRLIFPLGQEVGSWRDSLRPYSTSKVTNQFTEQTWPPDRKWPGKIFSFSQRTPEAQAEWDRLHSSSNYQRTYYARTAPQNDLLISHIISSTETNVIRMDSHKATENRLQWLLAANLSTNMPFNPANQFIISAGDNTNVIYTMFEKTNRLNHSGYWIIQAPREIIPDHDTIFTPNFYAMAAGLYRMSQYHKAESGTNGTVDSPGLGTSQRKKKKKSP